MNKEKFAEIAWDSRDTLYRVAKSILHNDTDCEDAVSQAIVNAFAKLDSLKKEEFAKTWLIRIVINECYRICRMQKWEQPYDTYTAAQNKGDSYTNLADDVITNSELYLSLMKLPVKYRLAITLYYIEGYSIKEIAQIQRTTIGTVKSRLSRGRQKLKLFLTQEHNVGEQKGSTSEHKLSPEQEVFHE